MVWTQTKGSEEENKVKFTWYWGGMSSPWWVWLSWVRRTPSLIMGTNSTAGSEGKQSCLSSPWWESIWLLLLLYGLGPHPHTLTVRNRHFDPQTLTTPCILHKPNGLEGPQELTSPLGKRVQVNGPSLWPVALTHAPPLVVVVCLRDWQVIVPPTIEKVLTVIFSCVSISKCTPWISIKTL